MGDGGPCVSRERANTREPGPFRRLLHLALAAALACAGASAQAAQVGMARDYAATWWNITNGLPQSSIRALELNERGEMWVATLGGLVGFDGAEFRRLDVGTLPGLRSNHVTALVGDGAGGLWFSTGAGSLHYLRGEHVDQTIEAAGPASIVALLLARDGSLWTQGLDGAVWRIAGGASRQILPPAGAGRPRGLCLRGDGIVCAVAHDEVVLLRDSGDEVARLQAPSPIFSLATDGERELWVGRADGLGRSRDGEIRPFAVSPPVSGAVHAIADDSRGALWVATERGIMRVSTTSAEIPRIVVRSSVDIPSTLEVRSILIDAEDNVWLGTADAGLLRLRPCRLRFFHPFQEDSRVSALCGDGAGGAWVACGDRGLVRIFADEEEGFVRPFDVPGPHPPVVHALLHDRLGRTWVGVNASWMRKGSADTDDFGPVLADHGFGPAAGPIAETGSGDVWLASQGGHVVRVGADDQVLEALDLPEPIHVLVAAGGALWAGGSEHVFRVQGGVVERFGASQGVPPGTVRDLAPDPRGGLWIATYGGGLALLADGRARALTTAHGLLDSSLSRLQIDADGRLWIASNMGLMVAGHDELVDVLDGRRPRIEPVVIGPETGMNEAVPGGPSGFLDARGRAWFGTIAGAVRVDTREFPFNRVAPRVHIRGVRAEDALLAPASPTVLPAGTRRLQFEFTAYVLTAASRTLFRYRLDGYDEEWSAGGPERQAAYTALSPGAYTFRVAARNEDGVWSDAPQSLDVRILPGWWQTPWFRAAVLVAALGALLGLHELRVGIVQRRADVLLEATRGRVLAEERSSRLREELAHVARVATAGELATSLAHEVNQPLAAIVTNAEAARRYLARDGTQAADIDSILRDIAQQGERASEVIRRLRQFLRKHESEHTRIDVNALVHETLPLVRRELEDHDAALDLDLAPDLPQISADPVQIQQVLVNLVTNACDALSDHAGERRIRVVTCATETGIALEVHDTGPGVAPDVRTRIFQPYVTTKPTGMGLGLPICRTIVEAHGGRLALLSESTAGAAFRIDLPGDARDAARS